MGFRDWATRVLLISLVFVALAVALLFGRVSHLEKSTATSNPETTVWNQYPNAQLQSAKNKSDESKYLPQSPFSTAKNISTYSPKYELAKVDPTNYGERFTQDINGVTVKNEPIIVLHETTFSASSAIYFFQTAHTDESVQASYHNLIKLDGTIIYLVPPDKRAFGAGNSVFDGPKGPETVKTKAKLPPSVNNFAYHVSLETPQSGWNDTQPTHTGYTEAQYNSLAWLIAQSNIPDERITTHKLVDRSGQKVDPRSFDSNKFFSLLRYFRQ